MRFATLVVLPEFCQKVFENGDSVCSGINGPFRPEIAISNFYMAGQWVYMGGGIAGKVICRVEKEFIIVDNNGNWEYSNTSNFPGYDTHRKIKRYYEINDSCWDFYGRNLDFSVNLSNLW